MTVLGSRIECYDITVVLKNLFFLSEKVTQQFEQVIVTYKKCKTTKNTRQWTENERELFAEVLADPGNNFAVSLEKLALKKSTNNELFSISKILLRWK